MKNNCLTLLFVTLLCVHYANCDLRFVFTMFRHGARSPTGLDKNNDDPFGEHWDNPGELTAVGRRMHFLLGIRNRQVYKDFTTRSKIDGSVFIRSTDYNRTIESVASQMQGFFPPGTGELLNKQKRAVAHPFIDDPYNSNWTRADEFLGMRTILDRVETFPIHLFYKSDNFNQFFYHPFVCKAFNVLTAGNRKTKRFVDFFDNLKKNFGEPLMKVTGHNNTDFLNLENYFYVFAMMDAFISDVYDGRDLTKAKAAGLDIQAFNKTAFDFAEMDILHNWNGDEEGFFARWTVSILWPEVIQWMEARIAADKAGQGYHGYATPRFAIFSTHDVTVGSGLTVLNRAFGFKKYYTTFASDIFFELHSPEGKETDYQVHVKYQSLTLGVVPFPEFKAKLEEQFLTKEYIAKRCEFPANH